MNKEKVFQRLDLVNNRTNSVVAAASWCAMHSYEADVILDCITARIRSPQTGADQRAGLVFVIHELLLTCSRKGVPEAAKDAVLRGLERLLPPAVSDALTAVDRSELVPFVSALEKALDWWEAITLEGFSRQWVGALRHTLSTFALGGSFSSKLQRCSQFMALYEEAKRRWLQERSSPLGSTCRDEAHRVLRILGKLRSRDFSSSVEFQQWYDAQLAQLNGGEAGRLPTSVKAEPTSFMAARSTPAAMKQEAKEDLDDDILGSLIS